MNTVELHNGDCLEVLRGMADASVDAIVTDPPYGLSFMGKRWDYDVPSVEVWAECLRVLKPGGHLLAFAGTRTQHRMAVRIEDAGFEIRDMIAWVYGSGYPKSLDVSKAIDKVRDWSKVERLSVEIRRAREAAGFSLKQIGDAMQSATGGQYGAWYHRGGHMFFETGRSLPSRPEWEFLRCVLPIASEFQDAYDEAEREVVGTADASRLAIAPGQDNDRSAITLDITAPATEAARQWQGWGTALKPALETVTFASKPFTNEQERDIILSNLIRLEARLWLLLSASAAEKSSTSNQSEYGAACAIAQWSADEITSTRAALCDPMGTSLFELATTTSLNIVSSWRRTLAESWNDGNTSTTETKSSTTTDLRTLKFSLSQITPASIIKACSLPGGFSVNASTAESHFNASLSLLQSIRTLSATERAMSQAHHEHRGAGAKPNLDPCIMARKPLASTVAQNVTAHGTGGLNIDGCRVAGWKPQVTQGINTKASSFNVAKERRVSGDSNEGRWPANLIHDGSEEAAEPLGSAARFFYCAKASGKDRDEGVAGVAGVAGGMSGRRDGSMGSVTMRKNTHPTVKPTDLMRYLCRLVTPPGGVVLDPFMGSGSTGKAAILEGFRFIGIEREAEYVEIARARIEAVMPKPDPPVTTDLQLALFP